MSEFKINDCAEVIATGRIGRIKRIEKTEKTGKLKYFLSFYDKSFINPEITAYRGNELRYAVTPVIKNSEVKSFVRGELTLDDITSGCNIVDGMTAKDSHAYVITAEDLFHGAMQYESKSQDDIYKWCKTILIIRESISLLDSEQWFSVLTRRFKVSDEVGERDIINEAYVNLSNIDDVVCYYAADKEMFFDAFRVLIDSLRIWIDSGGDDFSEYIARKIIHQYDCDTIDKQSDKVKRNFKKSLDYWCDRKDPEALMIRGYCYYCGTSVYPNDWIKARDAFIEYYQLSGDPYAANTLGYIYYYGRCNGGVPEYDQAFRYFSIGHAYGCYESTYKLADMFVHGYSVVKNEEIAYRMYSDVYRHNLKHFTSGHFECKFADAALRMGNLFMQGIYVEKDPEEAYSYYLQADYAIRKRADTDNCYGDAVVFRSIKKALVEARTEYHDRGRTVKLFSAKEWVNWVIQDHRSCLMNVKKLSGGRLSLNVKPVQWSDKDEKTQILVTIPKADYCELRKSLTIKTGRDSVYQAYGNVDEVEFDDVEYDYDYDKTFFLFHGEFVASICTSYYTFTAPPAKKVELNGNLLHFVTVCFQESGKKYDYLCDDLSVKAGDRVVIERYNEEIVVEVVAVSDMYESETGMPLERFKKILRKYEGSEE